MTTEAILDLAQEITYLRACLTEIFEYASDREDIDYHGNANDAMRIADMVPYSIQKACRDAHAARARQAEAALHPSIRNITWTPE